MYESDRVARMFRRGHGWPRGIKRKMQIIETLENRKDAVKVSELARLLSVTPKHIYKTRAAGRIPGAFRVNRALRFDPQILAEWLKGELLPDVAASRGKQKRTR